MDTFRIYKEEELLKTANGEYIVEAYKCRRVGDTIIGLCVNSSPMFCRTQKNVPKGDYSWIEVLKPTSSILEHDNTEERYNTICPKVVWGIAAYLLFHSYTDTKGRTLFKINQDVVQPSDLFRYYNEQNKKHYTTLNKEDFDYYKSIGDTTSFDKEFIEHHTAQEESLINRQNASIPDCIKEKTKEYIEWIKINYIKNEQCLKEKKNTPSPYSLEIIPNLKEEEKEDTSFRSLIQYEDKDRLLERLHFLIDPNPQKGSLIAAIIQKAYIDKYILELPNEATFRSEFKLDCTWEAVRKSFISPPYTKTSSSYIKMMQIKILD